MALAGVAISPGCTAIDDFSRFRVVGEDAAVVVDDLAPAPDLAPVPDLATPPDLAPGDLALPDLTPLLDLVPPPDLAPQPAPDLGLPTPPSCDKLAKICGPNKNADCCDSPLVTGGMFFRSYDVALDNAYPDKSFPAMISDFRLDRYEITVGRFRTMITAAGPGTQTIPPAAGAGAHPKIMGSGWDPQWNAKLALDINVLKVALKCDPNHQTWADQPGAKESLPINCVDWYTAFAFCAWDGGRLPTEAEWNYAATGGGEQRAYPWSNPPSSTTIDDTLAVYCGGTCKIQNVGSTSPKGDGRWGHADLSGNVWEWVLDWYAVPYGNPCVDCADVVSATDRVLRGMSFSQPAANLRVAARPHAVPANRDNSSGLRCARKP